MLCVIIKDIQGMIRRKTVFFLLCIGLIVGAFAIFVYYVESSQTMRVQEISMNRHRTIEYRMIGMEKKLESIIEDHRLPQIHYCAVSSYGNEDYDIIGAYWNTDTISLAGGGEYVNRDWMGQRVATVSMDIDPSLKIGDEIRVQGMKIPIIGLIQPQHHNPALYDARRIQLGAEYVAGETVEREEDLTERPEKAVVLPLDIFFELNLGGKCFHISFVDELTDTQREEIQTLLSEEYGLTQIIEIEPFYEVNQINRVSRMTLTIVALLLGLLNIILLFVYLISIHKKQYGTYYMLGCTRGKLLLLIIIEFIFVTVVNFAVGFALAHLFIKKTEFIQLYQKYSVLDFAFLYFVCVTLFVIVVVCCVVKLFKKSGTGKQGRRQKVHERNYRNKPFTLLSFRYKNNKQYLSIMFLSLLTAFTLSFAMTYVVESGQYERYIKKAFSYHTGAVTPLEYMNFSVMETFGNGRTLMENEDYLDFLTAVDQDLKNIIGMGIVYPHRWSYYNDTAGERRLAFLREVNRDFCQYSPVSLQAGTWQPLMDYDPKDESVPIPCIMTPSLKQQFPLGSEFVMEVEFSSGYDDENQYKSDWVERRFRVVGIADDSAYKMGYPSPPSVIRTIDHYLISYATETADQERTAYEIYIPQLLNGGKEPLYDSMPLHLLYTNMPKNEVYDNWRLYLGRFGGVDHFDECMAGYMEQFRSGGGNIYFMHAAVASALLILGVGGYSIMLFAANKRTYGIYYVCGMPWSKAAGLTVAGNALDMLLPAAVGAVAGVYAAKGIRVFDNATITLSILTGLGAVAALYALTSAIIALSMRKARPKRLMTEDGQ